MFVKVFVLSVTLVLNFLIPFFPCGPTEYLPQTGFQQAGPASRRVTPAFNHTPPVDQDDFFGMLREYRRSSYREASRLQALAQKYLGEGEAAAAVFVPGVLELAVVQQPAYNSLFVSEDPQAVTQFRLAEKKGSTGLLAHNFLAGQQFFELEVGDAAYVLYSDGSYRKYEVYEIADYQALTVYDYRDLETQALLDQYQVVDKIYGAQDDRLVFQTCIEKGGAKSWGRRFILARLVEESGPLG